MRTLFFVTSAISPSYGVFSYKERYEQTIGTINSIRQYAPSAKILLVDCSVNEFPDDDKKALVQQVDFFLDLSSHEVLRHLSINRMQSRAETLMTLLALDVIKNTDDLYYFDRIFKMTGRMELCEGFNLNDYDELEGKYVFKSSVPTWMPVAFMDATRILDTRLYSWCTSLNDTHTNVLNSMESYFLHVDFEHAMYAKVPKDKLVEVEKVHCKGRVASTGEWKFD